MLCPSGYGNHNHNTSSWQWCLLSPCSDSFAAWQASGEAMEFIKLAVVSRERVPEKERAVFVSSSFDEVGKSGARAAP